MSEAANEYTYLTVPPLPEMRPCVGLVLAGMVTRAKIGVGGLDEAVELLESYHAGDAPTRYRFSMEEGGVVVEVEPRVGPDGWRRVVELVA